MAYDAIAAIKSHISGGRAWRSGDSRESAVAQLTLPLRREIHSSQQVLEARIGPQVIETAVEREDPAGGHGPGSGRRKVRRASSEASRSGA
jgi:hypothetical protein